MISFEEFGLCWGMFPALQRKLSRAWYDEQRDRIDPKFRHDFY